jgi:hypothetical protein
MSTNANNACGMVLLRPDIMPPNPYLLIGLPPIVPGGWDTRA